MGAYEDLRNLPDADVIAKYDAAMGTMYEGVDFYRAELLRRETKRGSDEVIKLTAELVKYTREIHSLSLAVAGATIVALAISVVALLK